MSLFWSRIYCRIPHCTQGLCFLHLLWSGIVPQSLPFMIWTLRKSMDQLLCECPSIQGLFGILSWFSLCVLAGTPQNWCVLFVYHIKGHRGVRRGPCILLLVMLTLISHLVKVVSSRFLYCRVTSFIFEKHISYFFKTQMLLKMSLLIIPNIYMCTHVYIFLK